MSNEISYNGETISTPTSGQTVTLPCAGKKMAGNITFRLGGSEPSAMSEVELIREIVITEDTKFVVIDKDDNGNPFELRNVFIYGRSKASQNSNSSSSLQMFISADPEKYPVEGEFNTDFGRISISSAVPSPKATKTELPWATGFEVYGVEDTDAPDRMMLIRGTRLVDLDVIKNVPATVNGICNISIEVYSSNVWFGPGTTIKVYGTRT